MEVPDTAGLETVAAQKSEIKAREELDRPLETLPSTTDTRGTKRTATDMESSHAVTSVDVGAEGSEDADITTEAPTLSKNQQRKEKRRKLWEEKKKERRVIRKEKRHDRKDRLRQEREEEIAAAAAEGREPVLHDARKQKPKGKIDIPVTVILDCQFEEYMMEKEWTSLTNQVTRCYSDNRNAQFPIHMFISSYGGEMKKRHEGVLQNQCKHWKNVHFVEGDFMEAAAEAKELMQGPRGGRTIELLQQSSPADSLKLLEPTKKKRWRDAPVPAPELEAEDVDKSIVYLTADSPYVLERLEPNTCYVLGGIIDKNREKGLCHKIACEKNVRTARLPIGEYMVLQHRHILATNHVMEIMLKWLETGDWGTAFMQVIPARKGGALKEDEESPEVASGDTPQETPQDQPQDDDVAVEVIQVESTNPEEQGQPVNEDADGAVEVDGENSEMGLQKNSLGQQRWSDPREDDPSTKTTQVGSVEAEDQGELDTGNAKNMVKVEGENSDEGLQKNSLDQQRWSAPPLDQEEDEAAAL
ncbi:Uu.00g142540.m01.CDS01 [Anthostomella pinea]|uniref:tRNA (guanine(9)-N1)-methyltransferase n=1 Tax=Anthostomella pinea TaxID=933095 RepID=A0AAI8YLG2_9PEZI|nr:Uu.00g142540.m01.CDS01 [Anthostomella pinea]